METFRPLARHRTQRPRSPIGSAHDYGRIAGMARAGPAKKPTAMDHTTDNNLPDPSSESDKAMYDLLDRALDMPRSSHSRTEIEARLKATDSGRRLLAVHEALGKPPADVAGTGLQALIMHRLPQGPLARYLQLGEIVVRAWTDVGFREQTACFAADRARGGRRLRAFANACRGRHGGCRRAAERRVDRGAPSGVLGSGGDGGRGS